jgi:hypothetical protein
MAGDTIAPKDIWDALEKAGASAVQAAGLIGNAVQESALDPEAVNPGPPKQVGLWQWNLADYPAAAQLLTGNRPHDMLAQVQYLSHTGGIKAASGTTVAETAGNFAANYERCTTCQQGGAQYAARIASAKTIASYAASGDWPASTGTATDQATLTAADTAEQVKGQKECAWSIGWGGIPGTSIWNWLFTGSGGNAGSGEVCLVRKTQIRALLGIGLVGAGTVMMMIGLGWTLQATGALSGVVAVLGKATPGPAAAVASAAVPAAARGS